MAALKKRPPPQKNPKPTPPQTSVLEKDASIWLYFCHAILKNLFYITYPSN